MTVFNRKQLEFLLRDAKRELNLRKWKYPHWVADPGNKLDQTTADHQLVAQQKIIDLIQEQIDQKPNLDKIDLFNRPGIKVEFEDKTVGFVYNDDSTGEGGRLMKVWICNEHGEVDPDSDPVLVLPQKLQILEPVH